MEKIYVIFYRGTFIKKMGLNISVEKKNDGLIHRATNQEKNKTRS